MTPLPQLASSYLGQNCFPKYLAMYLIVVGVHLFSRGVVLELSLELEQLVLVDL